MTRRDPEEQRRLNQDQLEALVDRYTLGGVLRMLGRIAAEKAEHVGTNWQDRALAREWTQASRIMDRATAAVRRLGSHI